MAKSNFSPVAREVQYIHIAKSQLGMDEVTYRAMLRQVGGVDSSLALSAAGRAKVLAHLKSCGAIIGGKRPGQTHKTLAVDKQRIERKLGAQLRVLGKDWAYCYAVAKRIFPEVLRFEWLSVEQLGKVSGALERTIKFQQAKGA